MPLIIFTDAPVFEHAPLEVIEAVAPEFVVAVTLNVALYPALVGAPVKLTVGVSAETLKRLLCIVLRITGVVRLGFSGREANRESLVADALKIRLLKMA